MRPAERRVSCLPSVEPNGQNLTLGTAAGKTALAPIADTATYVQPHDMETNRLSGDPVLWPVIAFGADGSLVCVETLGALQRPSAQALRNGYINGLTLIDAEGVVRHVNGTITDNPILLRFRHTLNLKVPVELHFEECGRVTLDEAKAKIVSKIKSDSSFWESGGDLADLEDRIAAARSFTALCAMLR